MTSDDERPFDPFDDPDIWSDFEPTPVRQGPRAPRTRARPGATGSTPAAPAPRAHREESPVEAPSPSVARRGAAAPPRPHRRADVPRPAGRTEPPPVGAGEATVDDDFVDLPPESRVPRWLAVLLVVGAVVGVAIGGTWWWYGRQVDPPGPAGARVEVVVPEGASSSRIGSILADKKVVSNATLFNLYVGRKNVGPFQAGTYQFQKQSSFDEAIGRLQGGPGKAPLAATVKVTIPEGFTVAKIIDRIHEKVPRLSVAALQSALDSAKVPSRVKPDGVKSYEGLLFPATYEVGTDTTALQLLTEMAAEMDKRVDRLDPNGSRARIKATWGLDLSSYDLLKVASMIQYEAAGEQDAAKIGTVTYNRLRNQMPLQYDSTSIYEAGLAGRGSNTVDYRADTPYNTRTRKGLPPTPIAAPGTYALEGALRPAVGPWLYFVLTDTKEVTFAVTYDEFLQAKAQCRQRGLGCG